MIDSQRVVDDIRSFLHASDQTFQDTLRTLAADYADACNEANQRLRRCDEFLQKGLRSEALQYARAEPGLLEVLAVLDFPERAQWEQTALVYSLPPPPRLRLETAEALNKAYAEEKPLEGLLRQHRRLALARAPLSDRLTILHKIWRTDPGNQVWEEDVTALEQARFGQIREQVEVAVASRDLDSLFQARDELATTGWHVAPPRPLVEHIDNLARAWHLDKLLLDLQRVGDLLRLAWYERREQQVRVYLDQWKALALAAGLAPGDPRRREPAQCEEWLAQQVRLREKNEKEAAFCEALSRLEQALRYGAERERLEELFAVLQSYRRGIPKATHELYHQRMRQLVASRDRRDRYILALVFGAATLLLLGFFVWMHFHRS